MSHVGSSEVDQFPLSDRVSHDELYRHEYRIRSGKYFVEKGFAVRHSCLDTEK